MKIDLKRGYLKVITDFHFVTMSLDIFLSSLESFTKSISFFILILFHSPFVSFCINQDKVEIDVHIVCLCYYVCMFPP